MLDGDLPPTVGACGFQEKPISSGHATPTPTPGSLGPLPVGVVGVHVAVPCAFSLVPLGWACCSPPPPRYQSTDYGGPTATVLLHSSCSHGTAARGQHLQWCRSTWAVTALLHAPIPLPMQGLWGPATGVLLHSGYSRGATHGQQHISWSSGAMSFVRH